MSKTISTLKSALKGNKKNKGKSSCCSSSIAPPSTNGSLVTLDDGAWGTKAPVTEKEVSNVILSDISQKTNKKNKSKRGRKRRRVGRPRVKPQRKSRKMRKVNAWKSPLHKLNVFMQLRQKDRENLDYLQKHPLYETINSAALLRRLLNEKVIELKKITS